MNETPYDALCRDAQRSTAPPAAMISCANPWAAALVLCLAFAALPANAAEQLRLAVLKFGTVNWELETIRHHGLDTANGVELVVQPMASSSAAKVALQGNQTDAIVSDWIWVARQRAAGKDYVFIPYSKAVGGLVVKQDSDVRTLKDLTDRTIGIAGGPLDKSWLILQAYAADVLDFDLKAETRQVFAAPPLIFKKAEQDELDGAINFWHFLAKMTAEGAFRPIVSVADAATALSLDPETPLLGYVIPGALLRDKPSVVDGFVAASRAAKQKLAASDEEWNRLRPLMRAASDAEFEALKAGFRAGIPRSGAIDTAAADRMLALMADRGGSDLVGAATSLPDGVFYTPGR